MKKTVFYLLFLLLGASLYAQGFDSFMAKNPDKTFIGAIMQAESINEDTHRFIDVALAPITISFSHSIKSQKITPSYIEMTKVVQNLIENGKIPMQNVGLSHAIREIKSYSELNALFGQKLIRHYFSMSLPIKPPSKTCLSSVWNKSSFPSIWTSPIRRFCKERNWSMTRTS